MDGITVILLVVGVIFIAVMIILSKKKENAYYESGITIKRDREFYRQLHTFNTTVSSTQDVYDALCKKNLTDNSITCNIQSNEMVFKNVAFGGSFTAYFKQISTDSERFSYTFQVTAWTEHNGSLSNKDLWGANIVLTAIEKAILSLDAQATITRKSLEYKSKTKFL